MAGPVTILQQFFDDIVTTFFKGSCRLISLIWGETGTGFALADVFRDWRVPFAEIRFRLSPRNQQHH
jgi:hypothetical protein